MNFRSICLRGFSGKHRKVYKRPNTDRPRPVSTLSKPFTTSGRGCERGAGEISGQTASGQFRLRVAFWVKTSTGCCCDVLRSETHRRSPGLNPWPLYEIKKEKIFRFRTFRQALWPVNIYVSKRNVKIKRTDRLSMTVVSFFFFFFHVFRVLSSTKSDKNMVFLPFLGSLKKKNSLRRSRVAYRPLFMNTMTFTLTIINIINDNCVISKVIVM